MRTGLSWIRVSCFFVVYFSLKHVDGELQLVHTIFRHGERTPADTYPKDPYIDFKFEPMGWGQLTNVGKMSQYQQGKFLRAQYGDFLGTIYSPDLIYVQSSHLDRTKMSAQLELAGLWPPEPLQQWNPDLLWQPIPIHYDPSDKDILLMFASCPKYAYVRNVVKASKEVQDILEKYKANELYRLLEGNTGSTFDDPDDVMSLHSTLKTEEECNLTLPEWTRGIYPDKLLPLTIFSFVLNVYNNELQMLKAGPLLEKIISDMKTKINGTLIPPQRKMFMYSGHDSTVINVLSALKVWDPQIPSYGIMILIELHYDKPTSQHFVKLFLRNSTDHGPFTLTIPGCEASCELEKFVTLISPVLPTDWKQSCVVNDPDYTAPAARPP